MFCGGSIIWEFSLMIIIITSEGLWSQYVLPHMYCEECLWCAILYWLHFHICPWAFTTHPLSWYLCIPSIFFFIICIFFFSSTKNLTESLSTDLLFKGVMPVSASAQSHQLYHIFWPQLMPASPFPISTSMHFYKLPPFSADDLLSCCWLIQCTVSSYQFRVLHMMEYRHLLSKGLLTDCTHVHLLLSPNNISLMVLKSWRRICRN